MTVPERLREFVSQAGEVLSGSGITVTGQRELANGIRLSVTDGRRDCGVNLYYSSRKGYSIVPAGGDPGLGEMVKELLSRIPVPPGDTGPASSSPGSGSGSNEVSSGIATWIGTDEASSSPGSGSGSDEVKASSSPGSGSGSNEVSSGIATWIGTDEAGKGDYMGPLTVAAVLVDRKLAGELRGAGVRDSKVLSVKVLEEMASAVRRMADGRIAVVSVPPLEYNRAMEELRGSRKNSLDLLARCHAEAVADLIGKAAVPDLVLIDKFCRKERIAPLLPPGGFSLELRERAESDPAVAAASILARDAYMKGLSAIHEEFGILPAPGSGRMTDAVARQFVSEHGPEVLYRVAKVHFRNTSRVLSLFD